MISGEDTVIRKLIALDERIMIYHQTVRNLDRQTTNRKDLAKLALENLER